MLAAIGNYNLLEVKGMSETYTNGHEYFKNNTKNAVMQVYHGETIKTENKPSRDANYEKTNIPTENNNVVVSDAPSEQIEVNNTVVESSKPRDGIYELCNTRREKLLPFLNNNTMLFEKMARSFAWEINTNDKLKCCSQLSMVNAFYKCCEYGLDPASSLGHAWLVPYKSNIDLQIGYRGWLKLLFNSPLVANVYSYAVYEDDEFSYELGMNPNIKHIPSKEPKDLEKLIATYGVVKLKNGEAQIRVCFKDEIEESKAASRGSHKPDSPWRNHYEAMALVVPVRKMGKNLGLPLKIEDFGEASNV
jgi:recombination protein RecT